MTDLPLKTRLAPRPWPNLRLDSRAAKWLLPLGIFLLALIPRALSLDVFLTADEDDQLWFSAQFLQAILQRDWAGALVLGYPGVPTMALGALGLWLRYQLHLIDWLPLVTGGPDITSTLATVRQFPLEYIQAARLPLVVTASVVLVLIFLMLRRLFDRRLALAAIMVLAFDPFLLAHSRIIHVDAPLAYFMFAAFLAFVLYLDRGGWPWLILSGVLGALAVLSKTPGVILGPILLVTGLAYTLLPAAGGRRWLGFKRLIVALVIWGLIAALAFFALWPSLWARPAFALTWIIDNVVSVNRSNHPTSGVFWRPTASDQNPLYYFIVLPFHLTPLSSLGLLAGLGAIGAAIQQRWRGVDSALVRQLPLLLGCLAYVVLFVAPVSYVSRRGDRYILPIYLAVDLLAVVGLWWLFIGIGKWGPVLLDKLRRPERSGSVLAGRHSKSAPIWLALAVAVQSLWVLLYQPYYFDYFNPLVGGGRFAPYLINVGWGEGLDVAARYLDRKAGAKEQKVAAWYSWQFAPYFRGQTVDLSSIEPVMTADYTVFYINQIQRGFPSPEILNYFADREPEKVIRLGGVDYAWIYPGPIVDDEPPATLSHPTDTTFGGTIHLYGLLLPQLGSELPADVELPLTLFWQVLAPTSDKLNVALRLVDDQGVVWGVTNRFPIGGLWHTHQWAPGVFIRDEYKLALQPGTPPGKYRLEVEMYDISSLETYGLARDLATVTVVEPRRPVTAGELDPRTLQRVETSLGAGIQLVAHDAGDQVLFPGQRRSVKLFWQRTGSVPVPGDDTWVQIEAGSVQGPERRWLLARAPLASGLRYNVQGSAYALAFPAEVPPGPYTLSVMLLRGETGQPLTAPVPLGTWRLKDRPRNFTLPPQATAVSVLLNDEIELVGYRLDRSTVGTDENIPLSLYWRARQAVTDSYTVFVHAVGPDGVLRGQWDSVPGGGTLPTTGWLPNEIITDVYQVPLAEDAPAWKYDIYAGLYDAATGRRLPVRSQTLPVSNDRIFLGQVQVVP